MQESGGALGWVLLRSIGWGGIRNGAGRWRGSSPPVVGSMYVEKSGEQGAEIGSGVG